MPVHRVRRFAFVARATTRTSALLLARPCRRGLATATDDPRDSPSKGYVYSSLGLSVDVNNDAQRTAERPVEHALVVGGGVAGMHSTFEASQVVHTILTQGQMVAIRVGRCHPYRPADAFPKRTAVARHIVLRCDRTLGGRSTSVVATTVSAVGNIQHMLLMTASIYVFRENARTRKSAFEIADTLLLIE